MKIRIWAVTLNPFTHVGPFSTDLEYDRSHELAPGLCVVEISSPAGYNFVFDATTGALLGREVGRVLEDHKRLFNDDADHEVMKAKVQERRNNLMRIRGDAKPLDRETFFRLLHAV